IDIEPAEPFATERGYVEGIPPLAQYFAPQELLIREYAQLPRQVVVTDPSLAQGRLPRAGSQTHRAGPIGRPARGRGSIRHQRGQHFGPRMIADRSGNSDYARTIAHSSMLDEP